HDAGRRGGPGRRSRLDPRSCRPHRSLPCPRARRTVDRHLPRPGREGGPRGDPGVIVGIRHATVWNPEHLVYARLPGFHLSEEGRREATRLAQEMGSEPVVAVYASPLERAVETAQILAAPHRLGVIPDDRLLEWSFWVHWQG